MVFNIIDNIYDMYTKRFPNASLDNFLTYIKRNHPNQYKYAQQLVNKARDYKVATENEVKDFLKEAPQKAEQKTTEFKKAIDTKAKQTVDTTKK